MLGVPLAAIIGCTQQDRHRIDAPSLAVTQPVAGAVWTEGESYTIRWRSAGITRVNVGRSNDVRVRVENAAGPAQFADSPSFTIVGQDNRSSNR